jgi:hypothetical protein
MRHQEVEFEGGTTLELLAERLAAPIPERGIRRGKIDEI